jgi:DNA-binding SARP family transcriptional activator
MSANGRPSLTLFGAFELRCGSEPIALPLSAQRLLAFVALHDRPLRRIFVAGTLWADTTDERAAGSLRSALWRLRRSGHQLVDASSSHVRLAAGVDVDVQRAARLAHRLIDGSAATNGETPPGAELLPGWYEDWVVLERERLRQLLLHAFEALAERRIATGDLGHALEAALAIVRYEPLRESAHRLVIRIHLAEGNGCEALRQYELCRRLLRDRVGLRPSRDLDDLVAGLR